jgi:oxygen-dependent protoporphyrinogen oxidase
LAISDPERDGMTKRVAILGGGITGLSAAFALAEQPGYDVTVFEQSGRFGGKLKTDIVDGFVIEGGADAFLPRRNRFAEINGILDLTDQLIQPNQNAGGAFILRNGTLHPIPQGLAGLVPTRLVPMLHTKLISPLGKFRMLLELGLPVKKTPDDETLAAFARRRFGVEAYNHLLEPLLAGISSGDGEIISLNATYPQWNTTELEHGSVIRGMLRSGRTKKDAPAARGFHSYQAGMQTLVNGLVGFLRNHGTALEAGAGVTALEPDANGYRLTIARDGHERTDRFDGVIVALPAPESAKVFSRIDAGVSRLLREIPQRSAVVVSLGLKSSDTGNRLHGTGYLTPQIEGRMASAMTWSSSKWSHRAPDGHDLVRVYFGRGVAGSAAIDLDDDALIQAARDELREVVGIAGEPVLTSITRWRDSMPQYTLGHLDRVAAIESAVAQYRGLTIAGNMLRGVGIPKCMITAETAVAKIRTDLRDD